ncbi:acyl-CoA synthetase FdrA [Pasteurella testudinis]|uniref:acyl-CoA synthetase FdrA n=1 Tax=Pasteurella testudinis TaxID=761 RepID=UPI004059C298
MQTKVIIKSNTYFDSVSLMSISTQANKLDKVEKAFIAMATEMNKDVLRNLGLLTPEIEKAKNGDLFILITGESDEDNEESLAEIEKLFNKKNEKSTTYQYKDKTIESAKKHLPDSNLAVISVNGAYAAYEAKKALENGLNVMLFSDNIPIEEELALKTLAHQRNLLLMGPDCGTAIINNTALCFANNVRKGSIGIIAASGTGSQEISVRIHEFGAGISQLIGTGGRDLSPEIGGIMMIDSLHLLENDSETEVIILISKPPLDSVARKVLTEAQKCKKPIIVYFIGGSPTLAEEFGCIYANSTKEAALKAVLLSGIQEQDLDLHPLNIPLINEVRSKLKPQQQYIRGLFCGGTLCDEAMYCAMEKYSAVYSNIQKNPTFKLNAHSKSIAHTFLDFGDDDFTNGKPHPMIDPTNRIQRLLEEASDPEVGVILMDFILGYGSHSDPVGIMLEPMKQAKLIAEQQGRHLEIVGYVLGTDLDTPDANSQIERLIEAGVTYASSNTNAGLLAREFVWKGEE